MKKNRRLPVAEPWGRSLSVHREPTGRFFAEKSPPTSDMKPT